MGTPFEALYPLVFDSIAEGVFTVDRDFCITSFNREAERITGVGREAAVGRKCYDVLRASICQSGCALRRTLASGEPVRNVRVDVLDASMDVVPICVTTAVLEDGDGNMVGGVEVFRDLSEIEALRRELEGRAAGFADIVGRSAAMQEVFRLIPDVAQSDVTVLLEGPSGTGKELVARAIHDLSPRRAGPLVRVNCGALPDTLLESELFGYRKGAFTDAKRDKPGRFAAADGGTILLDEIGDVSPAFQVKLLRVLEDREIFPLGATGGVTVDVRVVAATNRNLEALVEEGVFREDLLYRLRVIPIALPPLARRREDIPLLAEHFRRRFAARTGKPIERFTSAAMDALSAHGFPGNVRELENLVERAFVLCHGDAIDVEHLPSELHGRPGRRDGRASGAAPEVGPPARRVEGLGASEAQRLVEALNEHGWDRSATARALGIGRTTLWRRMRRHGLVRPR